MNFISTLKNDYEEIAMGLLTTSMRYAQEVKDQCIYVKNTTDDEQVQAIMEKQRKISNEFIFQIQRSRELVNDEIERQSNRTKLSKKSKEAQVLT